MNDPYTDYQRRQHDMDGGFTATLAAAHETQAARLRNETDDLMPVGGTQYLFACTGTDEERKAAVDAWAARHHVTTQGDENSGYYAKVCDGPLAYMVVMIPEERAAGYIAGRVAAIKDIAREANAAIMTGNAA